MKVSLATHILTKVGGPVVLFFIFILVSDFYYLSATLKQDNTKRIQTTSEKARQTLSDGLQREKEFVDRLVYDVRRDLMPEKTTLDERLEALYGNLENTLQTIRRLFVFHQTSSQKTPSGCFDIRFTTATQGKSQHKLNEAVNRHAISDWINLSTRWPCSRKRQLSGSGGQGLKAYKSFGFTPSAIP